MHHVRIAFDEKTVRHTHASGFGDPADIVAAKVEQHEMLGAFLRIGDQFLGEFRVFFAGCAPRPRPGDRANDDRAVAQAYQDLRT